MDLKKQFFLSLFMVFTFVMNAQKRTYDIGMLFDQKTEEIAPFINDLEKEIKAVVGEDAIINFPQSSSLVNNFDLDRAKSNYNQLLENNTDIIIAFGVINNKVIANLEKYDKPTILFGDINKDFGYVNEQGQTSGKTNFTYILSSQSTRKDLEILYELTTFKKVGIAIDESLIKSLPFKALFDQQSATLNISYQLIPYKKGTDIINQITDSIDAFYLLNGYFLSEGEINKIANKLIEEKIPSFTNASVDHVVAGLMATNQSPNNFNRFIRHIALTIESYINGKNLSDIPVILGFEDRLTINHNTSRRIGMAIKYSLIATTNFVGDMESYPSENSYTLLDAINEGLTKNLSFQVSAKDVELSMQDVRSAKSDYLPELTANATGVYIDPDLAEVSFGQAPELSTDASLNFSQVIYSQAISTNVSVQKELLKAEQENLNASELDLVFDVSNAYFNILILKSNVAIQLQNLDLTKENLLTAEQNFNSGQSSKADVLRFESELAQNTQSMVEAINQLEQSFISLNQLLNKPLNRKIEVKDTDLNEGVFEQLNYEDVFKILDEPKLRESFVEFLVEEAYRNAPELKSIGYNINATDQSIKLFGSGRYIPTINLLGEYNQNFDRSGSGSDVSPGFQTLPTEDYNVALSISLPIFNRNSNNINKQKSIVQRDQLEAIKENTELTIASNVRNGVLNLINQMANMELSKVSEKAAKESLELIKTQYANGAVGIIQLLDYQNNYLRAQLLSTNATYNFLISAIQLERIIGSYFMLNTEEENKEFMQRFMQYSAANN